MLYETWLLKGCSVERSIEVNSSGNRGSLHHSEIHKKSQGTNGKSTLDLPDAVECFPWRRQFPPINRTAGGQAENPSGNHKDSKAQRKMFCIGVVVQHLVSLPAGRQVGDLSRSDASGSGYTLRLRS